MLMLVCVVLNDNHMMARVFHVGVFVVLDDNHMIARVFDVGVCCQDGRVQQLPEGGGSTVPVGAVAVWAQLPGRQL